MFIINGYVVEEIYGGYYCEDLNMQYESISEAYIDLMDCNGDCDCCCGCGE